MPKPIIAIDGPAGSGKSTLAKALALKLGLVYIDTGAMYRAVTLACLRQKVNFSDVDAVLKVVKETRIDLKNTGRGTRVYLGDEDVEDQIRTPEISRLTSQFIANIRGVRETLVSRQRELGKSGGVVMEGRDIGTVVFPKADLKVFFEVSVEERTRRRIKDFNDRGIPFDADKVRADIEHRDQEDRARPLGALKRASDAVLISGDGKTVEELTQEIMGKLAPVRVPDMFYYNLIWFCSRVLFKILLRIKVSNETALPKKGGVILVCNHESVLDPPIVGSSIKRKPVRFMARDSLFGPGIVGWFIKRIKAFPVKRGGADRHAWAQFAQFIKDGELVCFYPEGTRSADGQLQKANPGAGMLIHRCPGAVVLPVRIFGSGRVLHRDKGFVGFNKVSIAFGSPLDLSVEMAQEGSRELYAQIADKLMDGIAAIQKP